MEYSTANSAILGVPVSQNLRRWYDALIEDLALFWQQGPYTHFTNHGIQYSRVLIDKKLNPLVSGLTSHLTQNEVFVLAASAYLYETGIQSTDLYPFLNFNYSAEKEFSTKELEEIRLNKGLLSRNLIESSSKDSGSNMPWQSS